ncbi:mediator of RNA polymerase II transcription subunit 30 [Diachasma alloeum]|uniref:mediator of RNA polymerase II transcription subunit 30 n=1 Tax=Diachasma alloeum TaxID=454923 RepID=UPI0007383E65|nr:mediator of RNA polymerase II transcription subunit 30 [Diachasma alloeum]
MNPQHTGMVNPQQFGVSGNQMNMWNAQQVMAQQQQQLAAQQSVTMQQQLQQMQAQQAQQLQLQQQQQQQQQMQLQQQQQAANQIGQANPGVSQLQTPQTPVAPNAQQQSGQQQPGQAPQAQPGPQQPQQQASKEINTVSLCKYGQDTVIDIASRAMEVFQTLKVLQAPIATSQGSTAATEKKLKIQDQLRMIRLLFRRLKLIYEKCNENCQLQGMEYTHIESLIPLKEEWDMKSEEKKTSEAYRLNYMDSKEVMEQVIAKNRHLKDIIDNLRRIISEINTMLNMRRS